MKLLVGYYGVNNFGDELILKQYLKENYNENFILFSYGLNYSEKNVKTVYKWSNNKISNIKNFIYAVNQVKDVIWVGGTCFSDQDGIGMFRYMILAKLLGKKFSYINIGINNIKKPINKLKTFILLNLSEKISVRDLSSYKIAQSFLLRYNIKALNKVIETDLGEKYLNSITTYANESKDDSILLVAWRDLNRYIPSQSKIINELVGYIESSCFEKIIIINTDESKDNFVSKEIFKLLSNSKKNVEYLSNISVEEKINLLQFSSTIITSRLHIAIAGNLVNVPSFIYSYSDKVNFYKQESMHNYIPFKSFNELGKYFG